MSATEEFFPSQPGGVPWPRESWAVADELEEGGIDRDDAKRAIDELFGDGTHVSTDRGLSLALVVVHGGRIVFERYGRQPANAFHDERDITIDTPLISWSMAKSITHLMIGLLVDEGRIRVDDRVPIQEWGQDERRVITWADLLRMRDGLDFVEEYVVDESGRTKSDVIDMLFGPGSHDVFAYAKARPPIHPAGSTWSYSSGTTNVLCGLVRDVLGGRDAVDTFMRDRIFEPLGMHTATATFDPAGTFIGSSYVHASARDFAKFGYLYLRGGTCDGTRVVSEDWVNRARRQHAVDPENGHGYGEHWWTWNADERTFAALGYEGQRTVVVPDRDVVLVHLGKWETPTQPFLDRMLTRIIESVPLRRAR